MTTTSVGAVQISSPEYYPYLVKWAESVAALNRQPDRVVVVTNGTLPELAVDVVPVQATAPFGSWSEWLNLAIEHCPTDWIAWIGADDTYRPHALDGIDDCDADVMVHGMAFEHGTWVPNPSRAHVLDCERNLVPVGSPFRRWLWEGIPFQQQFAPFDDWSWWVGCAAQGATFQGTNRIDYDYRWHADTPTQAPGLRERIKAWSLTLGSSSPPRDATAS